MVFPVHAFGWVHLDVYHRALCLFGWWSEGGQANKRVTESKKVSRIPPHKRRADRHRDSGEFGFLRVPLAGKCASDTVTQPNINNCNRNSNYHRTSKFF